LREFKQITCHL